MRNKQVNEYNVPFPAADVWRVYSSMELPLLFKNMPEAVEDIQIIGNGGEGTFFEITVPPGSPFRWYKEKVVRVDHEERVKEVDVVQGGYLDIGYTYFKTRFEIIEKGPELTTVKSIIFYEINDKDAANEKYAVVEDMEGAAKAVEKYLGEIKSGGGSNPGGNPGNPGFNDSGLPGGPTGGSGAGNSGNPSGGQPGAGTKPPGGVPGQWGGPGDLGPGGGPGQWGGPGDQGPGGGPGQWGGPGGHGPGGCEPGDGGPWGGPGGRGPGGPGGHGPRGCEPGDGGPWGGPGGRGPGGCDPDDGPDSGSSGPGSPDCGPPSPDRC